MAKVFAPNKDYTGISANVVFRNGVGETSDPHLIEWFKSKGYTVEGAGEPKGPEGEVEPIGESAEVMEEALEELPEEALEELPEEALEELPEEALEPEKPRGRSKGKRK